MFTRIRSLLSPLSVPGWIVLGWVVLGEIHVATFGIELLHAVSDYFQQHLFYGLLIGFLLLFLAVVWPDIRGRFPAWVKLPETMHERVHRMDKALPELTTGHDGLCKRMGQIEAKLANVESVLLAATENAQINIQSVKISVNAAYQRTTDLVSRVNALIDARNKLFRDEIMDHNLFMLDVTRLIEQAETIREHLYYFKDSFPTSEVAKAPFSRLWPLVEAPIDIQPMVIAWFFSVNSHLRHCDVFADSSSYSRSQVIGDGARLLSAWNNSASMGDSITFWSDHRDKLIKLRQTYAANFWAEAVKVRIS